MPVIPPLYSNSAAGFPTQFGGPAILVSFLPGGCVNFCAMASNLLKFLYPLGQPIGFIWLLHFLGFFVLLKQRKWRGAFFFGAMAIFLSAIGTCYLPNYLLTTLERPYAKNVLTDLPVCDAVVMLGGTHKPSKYDPFGIELGDGVDRILAAVEVMRQQKAKALVLGGGSRQIDGKQQNENEFLQVWFDAWKLPTAPIHKLGFCANTYEEAVQTQALMKKQGWQKIILVTSAYHMERAEAIFKKLGVQAVALPCDFQAVLGYEISEPFNPFPDLRNITMLELYIHEKIGWLIYHRRGWL